jgi:hypothetical protein
MKFSKIIILTILASIAVIKSQNACTSIKPNQPSDCLIQTDTNNYCCYRTDDLQTSKSCVYISKSAYTPSQYFLNGVGYNQDCGVSAQGRPVNTGVTFYNTTLPANATSLVLPYQTCGISNPVYSADCTNYSVLGNSCCYFQKGLATGCYWLGQRFVGNATVADYAITCSAYFMSFKFVLLFFVMAFLFI